jgi:tripartite-type tricarboxylate transporter receptor subunit TctC
MQTRRRFLGSFALAAGALARRAVEAAPEAYPSRPIRMIVPFPAGGPTDAIGRVFAERMRDTLGQPIIVENVPGAAGSLGTERVALAVSDGYTIGLGNAVTHVLNGAIFPLKYDVVDAFAPISLLVNEPAVIVVRRGLPANDLRELVSWLKANPDKGLAGTAGVGTQSDAFAVFFEKRTGTALRHIPYRGLGPAIQALIAEQVDLVMSLPAVTLPQVSAGTIKALAVTSKARLAGAPDIPTVDEAGLAGFYQSNWHALFAPKGTPDTVIAKLNAAVAGALVSPDMRKKLVDLGQDLFPAEQSSPAALADFQRAEIQERWPIIKAAGIKIE